MTRICGPQRGCPEQAVGSDVPDGRTGAAATRASVAADVRRRQTLRKSHPACPAQSFRRSRIQLLTLLLGAPALALLWREPQAVMLAVSFVRGLGFGLCGVVTGALTATLLPPGRRGEGLGLLGIVSGVPAVVALPAGVWLAGHHLGAMTAAAAAAAGLLPLAAARWLPGQDTAHGAPRPARTRRAPGGALRLPLIFAASTVAA